MTTKVVLDSPASAALLVLSAADATSGLEQALAELGYRILGPHASLERGRAALHETAPALVVVSLSLALDAGAHAAFEKIRSRGPCCLVLVSSRFEPAELERASRLSPSAYLTWPCELHALRATLYGARHGHTLGVFDSASTLLLEEEDSGPDNTASARAFGRIATMAVHDFNNILTGIRGSVHLVRPLANSAALAYLDAIDQSVDRGVVLTNRLLSIARVGATPTATFVHPNQAIVDLRPALMGLLGPHLRLTLELDQEVGPMLIDKSGLERTVMNLVINAKDAMEDAGELRIKTFVAATSHPSFARLKAPEGRGSFFVLQVSDTGKGIAEALLDKVFVPFFTTKAATTGTGLGLSSVRDFARAHGGEVLVESKPQLGSTFTVWLPLEH